MTQVLTRGRSARTFSTVLFHIAIFSLAGGWVGVQEHERSVIEAGLPCRPGLRPHGSRCRDHRPSVKAGVKRGVKRGSSGPFAATK